MGMNSTKVDVAGTLCGFEESCACQDVFDRIRCTAARAAGQPVKPQPVSSDVVVANELFGHLVDLVRRLPVADAVATCGRYERSLAGVRIEAAARAVKPSGDPALDRKRARTVLNDPDRSARSIHADARRATAVSGNERLGRRLGGGAINPESIDALARAADHDSGLIPDDLVEAVSGLSPDQARRTVDSYLEDRASRSAVEERDRRQWRARRVRRYTVPAEAGRPPLAGVGIEGPDAEIERLWAEINACAGRHVQPHQTRPHAPVGVGLMG